jgi:chorismate mutase/prephenate dehydratase
MGAKKEKEGNLEKIREDIDSLDAKIVKLLDERTGLIKEVGQAKKDEGFSVYSPGREKEVIEKLAGDATREGFPADGVKAVFEEIFTHSRLLQEPLKIAFLGPANTFTHMAAIKKFGRQAQLVTKDSIKEVFNAIDKKEADFGVVPVENSTEELKHCFRNPLGNKASSCFQV